MYSSNHYRSPYKAPSRSANTYEYGNPNRSRTNLNDSCDETWPLDEVINKIDVRSDSEDDFHYNRNYSWNRGTDQYTPRNTSAADTIYSAFPDHNRQSWNTRRDYSPKRSPLDSNSKWPKSTAYDSNNNYLNDDNWKTDIDDGPTLRDVAIQCNLKKYKQTPKQHWESTTATSTILSQKPPIKVIKSSTNGFVSAYSDVPKLTSPPPRSSESQYCALDFDKQSSFEPTDVIYSQVDKSGKMRPNSATPSNLDIVYKQPLNDSITSYRVYNDNKTYDIKSKEFGFSVANPAAPRVNLPNPELYLNDSNRLNRSYNDSSFRTITPIEKEILEETISISNASSDDLYRPSDRIARYADNMSYTSKGSSNYRRESPVRFGHDRSNVFKQSPYGTMEKVVNRETKVGKLKKKKNSTNMNDENVLLANNSLRLKSSKYPQSERLYKSNADLRDQFMRDETRGGLAAAYKNRQQQQQQNRQRALSLNRMNAIGHDDDRDIPARHLSQTQLNGGRTNSRLSHDSGSGYHPRSSRHLQHERDPIVMYIPNVTNQRINESPKLTKSILRNNSTKSMATLPSKAKKAKEVKESKSQSKTNLKEFGNKDKTSSDSKKKIDLNRSHSMPKDTRFNWLSKLKLKSK